MAKDQATDWGIHWFRRDLRFDDNPALAANLARTKGRTLGLFCFDSKFLSREDFSHRRFAFFIATIKSLREDLARRGGEMLVVDCQPDQAFEEIVRATKSRGGPKLVTFNRDYEPFARNRDDRVAKRLGELGVEVEHHRDHLIFEPEEIKKPSGDPAPYQKYSPYLKRWIALFRSDEGRARLAKATDKARKTAESTRFKLTWDEALPKKPTLLKEALARFEAENAKHFHGELPDAGFVAGRAQIKAFGKVLGEYAKDRAVPARRGSAELSKYLKNGSITLAHVINDLKLKEINVEEADGPPKFLKELIWREFYYYTLFHFPKVEDGAFIEKYRAIRWDDNEEHFEKWKRGETGVPIVDAGMRELAETGWINNRVRIIVATYLIKDLLIDWRWGEQHFMHELIDGDLAANNGNWQWVASTGGDSQPFFRVMNPWTQGKNFDADAEYIKQWVPELADAPAKILHEETADRTRYGYPRPLTVHSKQKPKAIALYKQIPGKPVP